jgi:hypothetical protein
MNDLKSHPILLDDDEDKQALNILKSLNQQQQLLLDSTSSTLMLNTSLQCCDNSQLAHSFILDENQVDWLNFKEILQLFGCAISQEQAWAVLNQCLTEFKYLIETNIELLRLNQDQIDINLLNFTKDGSILFGFKRKLDLAKLKNENTASNSSNLSISSSSCTSLGSFTIFTYIFFYKTNKISIFIEEKTNLEAKVRIIFYFKMYKN